MDDRRASWVAAACGSAAIGGFWLARPAAHPPTLRVLEQWTVPPVGGGVDRDASTLFRLADSAATREAQEDGRGALYALIDGSGRQYPLVPSATREHGVYKLQSGYAHGVPEPRLALFLAGRPVASVAVKSIPDPYERRLSLTSTPPLRLIHREGPWIEIKPVHPLSPDERWRLVARRTAFSPTVDATAELPRHFLRGGNGLLMIPFADEAKAVELDLYRARVVRVSERVVIPGLRLASDGGTTTMVVDRPISVVSGLGARIDLRPQSNAPRRRKGRGDPLTAEANLTLAPPVWRDQRILDDGGRRGTGYRMELLSPAPADLGLRSLRVGLASRWTPTGPLRPLKTGPFSALIRIAYVRYVPYLRQRVVAKVEKGGSFALDGTPTAVAAALPPRPF